MKKRRVPRATTKRLPIYYQYLSVLSDQNVEHIASAKFAKAIHIDSATIRRDFSCFGALGRRGYGYDVNSLLRFFKKILHQDHLTKVALIGLGNLGLSLLHYNFKPHNNIRIAAVFEKNTSLVDTIQDGVPVYNIKDLTEQLKAKNIKIAILAVPDDAAQAIVNEAVKAGVRGIMNYTDVRLATPVEVHVQNIDLTNELQTLIYFVKKN